jgi:glutathione S-transferase
VRRVQATLYVIPPSHPSHAARLMLEHKGIDAKVVDFVPGMHAALVRAAGFPRDTVPALRLDGRKIQGTREISRELDRVRPEPPLIPADPGARAAVEEAERWGDEELQEVPRFVTRWLAMTRPEMRVHMATEAGIPAPRLLGPANAPVARHFARKVGADDPERVRALLASLPEKLDHIDRLIAEGVIGGEEPNAADLQIAPTVRVLMTFEDLRPVIEGRPAAELATRLVPDYPTSVPAGMVPAVWLDSLRG